MYRIRVSILCSQYDGQTKYYYYDIGRSPKCGNGPDDKKYIFTHLTFVDTNRYLKYIIYTYFLYTDIIIIIMSSSVCFMIDQFIYFKNIIRNRISSRCVYYIVRSIVYINIVIILHQ